MWPTKVHCRRCYHGNHLFDRQFSKKIENSFFKTTRDIFLSVKPSVVMVKTTITIPMFTYLQLD